MSPFVVGCGALPAHLNCCDTLLAPGACTHWLCCWTPAADEGARHARFAKQSTLPLASAYLSVCLLVKPQMMEEHGVGYSTTGLVAQMREQEFTWKQASAAADAPQF